MSYVSSGQVNFIVPETVPPGRHDIRIGSAVGEILVLPAAPGIFTANGRGTGVPIASVIAVLNDGTRIDTSAFTCGSSACGPAAIRVPGDLREMHLVLMELASGT